MKFLNKYISSVVVLSLLVLTYSCKIEEDVAEEIDPATYPVLTITPDSAGGVTVNEEGSPSYTFSIQLAGLVDHDINISAKQVGGTASADDFTFSSVNVPAYGTEATFTLSILEDGIAEATETLEIEVGPFDPGSMYTVNPSSENARFTISIENCAECVTCDWTLDMQDDYGDGWNGGFLTFDVDGTQSDYSAAGTGQQEIISISDQKTLTVSYTSGAWEGENTFQLYNPSGVLVLEGGPNISTGELYSILNVCP